jgi:hypothetical protein
VETVRIRGRDEQAISVIALFLDHVRPEPFRAMEDPPAI